MLLTSAKIRELIRVNFDEGKGFWEDKLSKTNNLRDKSFYSPPAKELEADFIEAKALIAKRFGVSASQASYLATTEDIYDCDNMARRLRAELSDIHYYRYRKGLHACPWEYGCLQVTDKSTIDGQILLHDFCMIFAQEGIFFADLMRDDVWPIEDFKPNIIGIS